MNAHTPFDANQDWTNPYCQNSSNDPMVDALLGNAYHVVRTVYCNLGNLKLIYDFLNKYGMVLGVQSETELKAMPTSASYVRLYGFDNTNKRVVTDYLYVEGDRTGVIPDDPSATGSWILVATSNSDSGGDDGEGKASPPYIPYSYNNGSAIGGETTIPVPAGTVGVPMIVIDGYTNLVGYGFTYDASTLTVTLAQPLEPGDEVHLFLTGTPAVPDNPNVSDWVQINWLYNGGYASGGEQVIAIPYTFESVPAIYKNGERYYAGLADKSYAVDAANQRILLTEPLATNDRLIVQIGGESTTLIMSDRTLQEVARAANVHENDVILSTNTTQYLNGMKVVYDVVAQKIYGLPTLPTNVYINSVSNGQLTYSPRNITVDLLPAPGSSEEIAGLTAGSLEYRYDGTGTKRTIQDKLNERVSLVDFHHDSNGVFIVPGPTVDSRPYIQDAIDYLSSIGGGTLVIPKTDSHWFLNSYGTGGLTAHSGIIQLRSDVCIQLEGTIKLGNFFTNKVFQVFVGFFGDAATSENLNNVHIYGGGVLDFANVAEPTTGSTLRNGFTFGKSYHCSLRNITVQNGDVTWAVTTGWNGYGSNTYIEDCSFLNLVQTTNNPDHTTIYINSPISGVRRCNFYSPATRGRDIACAVELHQHTNWFEECTISGYARGCYVTMHGAESTGAGAYTNNVSVRGITGDIAGQFAVFVADLAGGVQGHINGAIVSDNIIIQPEGYANGAFILYAEGAEGLVNLDVSGVLVTNNHYTTPSTSDSTAFQSSVTVNGITFIGNYFDTRRAVKGPDNNVVCRGLVWDESNVIGPTHSGMRASISLFELKYATVVNTHIVAKLRSPDTSMYSVILVPTACTISDSVLVVRPDFITTDRNAIAYEGNQQNSSGLQTEYPITVEFTSPSATGAAPYASSLTSFGWASSATPLNNASGVDFYTPSALSVKGTGQLVGIGWNDTTASRTVYIRVLLKRYL